LVTATLRPNLALLAGLSQIILYTPLCFIKQPNDVNVGGETYVRAK